MSFERVDLSPDVTLYLGDCLEVMRDVILDRSVSLVLTDIPYDEVSRKSNGLRKLDKGAADVITFDVDAFITESLRVGAGSFYVFCGMMQLSAITRRFREAGLSSRTVVWEKTNPSPMNAKTIWLSGIEVCAYAKRPKATFNGFYRNTVLRYPIGRSKVHETEKSLRLFTDLAETSSNAGDLILDACMGSGTTGVAAVRTGRRFIGIEKDPKYFEIAVQRIKQALAERDHVA